MKMQKCWDRNLNLNGLEIVSFGFCLEVCEQQNVFQKSFKCNNTLDVMLTSENLLFGVN